MGQQKVHHCFNCGAETENWDYLTSSHGRKIYVCDDPACIREHRCQIEVMENEKRWRAEEDNYDRY